MASAIAPPEPPSPITDTHQRHRKLETGLDRARNRLGLPALLSPDTRIGAGRIDQGQNRQLKTLGELHQPHSLSVALGVGHAEIMAHPPFRIRALFMPNHHDRATAKPRQPPLDRLIITKIAVTRQRRIVVEEHLDIGAEMRPLGMSRHLSLLPGRQLGICLAKQLVSALLQPLDLISEINVAAFGKVIEFLDLAFELTDGLLEF